MSFTFDFVTFTVEFSPDRNIFIISFHVGFLTFVSSTILMMHQEPLDSQRLHSEAERPGSASLAPRLPDEYVPNAPNAAVWAQGLDLRQ